MATIQPIIHVDDVDASLAYYRDVLGFNVDFTLADGSGKTVHAEISRNGACIMFGAADTLSEAARSLLGAGTVLYITDNDADIDAYYAEVRGRGAKITEEICDQFWGDRTFSVKDPDGYNLTFARNIRPFDPTVSPS